MSYSGRGLQGWPLAVALLIGVYAAGVGALLCRPEGAPIATWWPAAGIAVILVSLVPRSQWWWYAAAIVVVTAAANVTGGLDLGISIWLAVANAAGAVAGAAALCRGRGRMP